MKNNNKFIIFSLCLLLICSCENDDALPNDFYFGASLSTNNRTTELPVGVATASFSADFVLKAPKNGASVDKIDVSVDFKDVINDGTDLSKKNAFIESIPSSELNINDSTRPKFSYQTTLQDIVTALGISIDDVDGDDEFDITFTIVFEGREIPISYNVKIVCPPTTTPTPGTWVLDMQDSFSDSWDGASLDIFIDGVSTRYTMSSGIATVQFTFEVPNGTQTILVTYNETSSYPNEHTFQIISASGDTVANAGPFTQISGGGTIDILLNYCAF